jgi:hypothetical protein
MLKLFPNPAKTQINLFSTTNLKGSTIIISDAIGRTIQVNRINEDNKELLLDLQSFESGVYFLQIQKPEGKVTLRFIRE